MKKLMGILILMLISFNIFGQDDVLRGSVLNRNFYASMQFKFTVGSTSYVLAYDNSPYDYYSPYLERNVYLYTKENVVNWMDVNGWKKISDVIRTDVRTISTSKSEDNYGNPVWYFESFNDNPDTENDSEDRKDFEHSYIKMVNGNIEIKILIFYGHDCYASNTHDDTYQHRWEYYILVPTGNGIFKLK